MKSWRTVSIIFGVAVLVAALVTAAAVHLGGAGGSGFGVPTNGCTEVSATELYVQRAFQCEDGTRVLTFAGVNARDDYLAVAEHFGAVVVERGPDWARVR